MAQRLNEKKLMYTRLLYRHSKIVTIRAESLRCFVHVIIDFTSVNQNFKIALCGEFFIACFVCVVCEELWLNQHNLD